MSNRYTIRYSSEDLDIAVDPFFERTEDKIELFLNKSGWKRSDVTDIVLLGGSSKLQFVQDGIRRLFGKSVTIHKDINPDTAVALGAAAVARQASGKSKGTQRRFDNFHLQDSLSYSIGVTVTDDKL